MTGCDDMATFDLAEGTISLVGNWSESGKKNKEKNETELSMEREVMSLLQKRVTMNISLALTMTILAEACLLPV